jgi:hypothetical protein
LDLTRACLPGNHSLNNNNTANNLPRRRRRRQLCVQIIAGFVNFGGENPIFVANPTDFSSKPPHPQRPLFSTNKNPISASLKVRRRHWYRRLWNKDLQIHVYAQETWDLDSMKESKN